MRVFIVRVLDCIYANAALCAVYYYMSLFIYIISFRRL